MTTQTDPDLTSGYSSYGYPALTSANPQAITFMSLVASVFKSGAPMLYDPDLARRRDPSVWDKLMLDDDVRPAWLQRIAKVVRLDWTLEPGDDTPEAAQKAAIVEALLRKTTGLYEARRHLAHAAAWGYAPVWTRGSREWRSPTGLLGEWWAPTDLQALDIRQIALVAKVERGTDGRDVVVVTPHMATLADGTHRPIESPECLILHVWGNDTLDRKGYGRGLDEPLFQLVWIKTLVRSLGLAGFEKFANGIVDVGVDSTAAATTADPSSDVASAYAEAVATMRSNGYFIHDIKDTVSITQSSGTGQDATVKWMGVLGQGITRVILNSILPSGQGADVGSNARAGEEASTTDDVLDAERTLLDNVITSRLVGLICDLNEPEFAKIGIAAAPAPTFRSTADEHEDPEKWGRVVEAAQRCGLKVTEAEAYRRFKIAAPAPGEKILAAPKPEPAFGGFGGGAFGGPPAPRFDDAERSPDAKLRPQDEAMLGISTMDFSAPFREEEHPRNHGEFARKGNEDGASPKEASSPNETHGDHSPAPKPDPSPDEIRGAKQKPTEKPSEPAAKKSGAGEGEKKAAPGKKPPPGHQLDEATRARLKELRVKDLPKDGAYDIQVHNLSGADVNDRAVMTWRQKNKHGEISQKSAYTKVFHDRNRDVKFARAAAFAPRVAKLRRAFAQRIEESEIGSNQSEGATCAAIIAFTGLRPGGSGTSEKHGHYGVTTLRSRHVSFDADGAHFEFVGKSGKVNHAAVSDPAIVNALQKYKERAEMTDGPDGSLFRKSALNNAREETPKGMKLKDFRTVLATQVAEKAMGSSAAPPPPLPSNETEARKLVRARIMEASGVVAKRLNNTPSVARESYINPRVFQEWGAKHGIRKEWLE